MTMLDLNNAILVSLLVIALTTLLLFVSLRKATTSAAGKEGIISNKKPIFVIAGPSNSGKTSLFTLLSNNKQRPTVTSLDVSKLENLDNRINVIEFPGHFKLRYKLIDFLKKNPKIAGVIYVVDSTVDPKELTKTAEFLLDVLLITESKKNMEPNILIACNKSESFSSRPPLRIKEALETEISKIIVRKKKSIGDVNIITQDGTDESNELEMLKELSSSGKFSFNLLEGSVDAISGSVLKKDIVKWQEWIEEQL
ncbi:Signal recognition particle receptor subunit beta NDAI_0C03870 [Naumovozyma dairenensis CBS 421]|uniref:Signal recognition particle receptor subunit beta n=1 Tax=Naumovozyma dairenensis (strain ATCC 10597 / BCRC 20456 / CBS 421 / NBRC 0211 / NRRL Y-12639) TaxID=1071378 RepID=G0W8D6_NAUDC|nr:hypothetical protein NDAI_0C03870 [Naumovozyma dairenensis CBS 421]CCD24047.1 hypothetical protein NDAI_0C03870 [Naumovozyma dairenensis CBS 421]